MGEYSLIVLPHRVRTVEEYLRDRRAGRGVALDRGRRIAVWELIDAYRPRATVDGTLDFLEAAVATAVLEAEPARRPADHVLVDEGQDLSPVHWQMLRAAVAEGPDDLFLEDATEATDYRSARSGPAPAVTVARTLGSELDEVAARGQTWNRWGSSGGHHRGLVPDRYQRDRVGARLVDAHAPARAVDREKPPTDNVLVMTMHRAKGMEFSRVVPTARICGCRTLSCFCRRPPYRNANLAVSRSGWSGSSGLNAS